MKSEKWVKEYHNDQVNKRKKHKKESAKWLFYTIRISTCNAILELGAGDDRILEVD